MLRKALKRSTQKISKFKTFLKKKKKKSVSIIVIKIFEIFLKKKNKKKVEYTKKYYLAHKKQILGFYTVV